MYNPEATLIELIGQLEVEAAAVARKRDAAADAQDRHVLDAQLLDIEERINRLKRQIRLSASA